MKRGFRPHIVGQIFAAVPCARSRCLSAFVSIARHNLPLPMRYEPSQLLLGLGIGMLLLGWLASSFTHLGTLAIGLGWAFLGLALVAALTQERVLIGQTRWKLIQQLDETRRSVGLDQVILPESLELLERAAQQWERTEHELAAQVWSEQSELKARVSRAAHRKMEDIIVAECGSTIESGVADEDAYHGLNAAIAQLSRLADFVDAASSELTSYPREQFESSGVEPLMSEPALEALDQFLASWESAINPATIP